jgi:hypothetical protein
MHAWRWPAQVECLAVRKTYGDTLQLSAGLQSRSREGSTSAAVPADPASDLRRVLRRVGQGLESLRLPGQLTNALVTYAEASAAPASGGGAPASAEGGGGGGHPWAAALGRLTTLELVKPAGTPGRTLACLACLPGLENLSATSMGLSSLRGLGGLGPRGPGGGLVSLSVSRNPLRGRGSGKGELAGLTRLTRLDAEECGLRDLRPLAGCTALQARQKGHTHARAHGPHVRNRGGKGEGWTRLAGCAARQARQQGHMHARAHGPHGHMGLRDRRSAACATCGRWRAAPRCRRVGPGVLQLHGAP